MENDQNNETVGFRGSFPFTIMPDAFIDDTRKNAADAAVFMVICRHLSKPDETGKKTAYPGYTLIAAKAGISRPTAIKAVKHLEELGYLVKEQRRSESGDLMSNLYTVIPDPGVVKELYHPSKGALPRVVKEVDCKGIYSKGIKEGEEEIDRLPALSLYTDIEELYTDRTLPFTETEKEAYLDRLTKYGKEAVMENYRPWFESKIKSRGQCPKREWWLEVPIIKKKEVVGEEHKAPICEHCGKPMLSGICKNKDCPQYIGLENIHLHLQKQGYDDTSPAARMVESLVGAAV